MTTKAFKYEEGQFICHLYAETDSDEIDLTLGETIDVVNEEQKNAKTAIQWKPLLEEVEGRSYHISLLRGHRAVYYHQINSLVESVRRECESLKPFLVYLSELRIFNNFEGNKQFLCLVQPHNQASKQIEDLSYAKCRFRSIVDEFALKLTDEDETSDTLAHCSFMYREVGKEEQQICDPILWCKQVEQLYHDVRGGDLFCALKVDRIAMRIGSHVYNMRLAEQA